MPYFGKYITKHGAEALRNYQYSASDNSITCKYIFNPIWNKLVTYLPLWLAPNTITLLGLGFTLVAHGLSHHYSPTFSDRLPDWLYYYHAFALLAYQTLDALDGKQARRTGSSSPMGLLFDHGCDAVNNTVIGMIMASVLELGADWKIVAMWCIISLAFFAGTWEEYYTGTLHLPLINAPNEGLQLSAITCAVAPFLPRGFWTTPAVPNPVTGGLEAPNAVLISTMFAGGVVTVATSVRTVVNTQAKHRRHSQVGALTEAQRESNTLPVAFTRTVPMFMVYSLFIWWIIMSPTQIFQRRPTPVLWLMGLLQAKITVGVMLAHLCDMEYHPWSRTVVAVLAVLCSHCVALQLLDSPWNPDEAPPAVSPFMEDVIVYQMGAVLFLSFAQMIYSVIDEIKTILGIKCFVIPGPKDKSS